MAPGCWLRRPGRTRAFAAWTFLFAACWVVLFFVFVLGNANPRLTETSGAKEKLAAFFLGLPAIHACVGCRVVRSGLWLGAEHAVIRGPMWTRTVALQDIESCEPGVRSGGGPCPMLVRTRYRINVAVWALGRGLAVWNQKRDVAALGPLCDELNQLLRQLQAVSGTAPKS